MANDRHRKVEALKRIWMKAMESGQRPDFYWMPPHWEIREHWDDMYPYLTDIRKLLFWSSLSGHIDFRQFIVNR